MEVHFSIHNDYEFFQNFWSQRVHRKIVEIFDKFLMLQYSTRKHIVDSDLEKKKLDFSVTLF